MRPQKLMMRRMQLSEVGRWAFPWLVEMGERAKSKHIWPLGLYDYYKDTEDAVVASIVGLLIPHTYKRVDYMTEIRSLLGDSPMEMVRTRAFLHRFSPSEDFPILNSTKIRTSHIAELLDWCWKVFVDLSLPMEYVVACEATGKDFPYPSLADFVCVGPSYREDLKVLLALMTLKDGAGRCVWNSVDESSLPLPLLRSTHGLLYNFYRLEKIDESSVGEILEYMGFEKPVDFIYTQAGIERQRGMDEGKTDFFLSSFREHIQLKNMLKWCSGLPYYTAKLKNEIPDIII